MAAGMDPPMSRTREAFRIQVMSCRCVQVKSSPTLARIPSEAKWSCTRIVSASTRYWMYFS